MKAYIVCIITTFFINLLATFFINKKGKTVGILLLLLSLFIACLIAGVRNITVGSDVRGYVQRLVNVKTNSLGFLDFMKKAQSDFLFQILIYFGSGLKNDIHLAMFFIELAVALPIYLYAYLQREKIPIYITLLTFFLTMYCYSFSMMRQSIAVSICILSYYYLDNGKYKKFIFLIICAELFHKTAIVFLIVYFIKKIIKDNNKYKLMYIIGTILLLAIIFPFLTKIISSSSYSYYIEEAIDRDFSLGSIIKKVIFVIPWILFLVKEKKTKDRNELIVNLILAIIALYCTVTSFVIPGMGRLGYYFSDLIYFLIIEYIPKYFKQKYFAMATVFALLIVLWWKMTYVKNDPASVYPYESDILSILNEERN